MYYSLRRLIGHRLTIASLAAGLAGCSIYPLPQDVSRKDSYDIVQKIRCEAQQGLREGLLEILGDARPTHRFLTDTFIGYDFVFDMTEDNNATAGKLEFDRPGFTKGSSFALDLGASATRQRKNKRDFRIIESLKLLNDAKCLIEDARKNWKYPITGSIGLDEIVRTYIRLEKLTSFASGATKLGGDPVTFSDDLDFTTEFAAGATPDLTLATVVGSLRLTKASVFGQAKRKDTHSVTIALARDSKAPADEKFERSLRRFGGAERTYSLRAARGIDAVAQRDATAPTRVLLELERRRSLKEDERLVTKLLEILKTP